MVFPSLCCILRKSQISRLALGSIPTVGSSRNRYLGSCIRALAIMSLRFMPPDRPWATRLRTDSRPRKDKSLSVDAAISAFPIR